MIYQLVSPYFVFWFSTLLREVFLRVARFSPLFRIRHLQFQFDNGMRRISKRVLACELVGAPRVNKSHITYLPEFMLGMGSSGLSVAFGHNIIVSPSRMKVGGAGVTEALGAV